MKSPILEQFSLAGRVAAVTGGTRGLGAAMAMGLAEAGADIAIIARDIENTTTRDAIHALGRRTMLLQADMALPEQRQGLIDKVVREFGRIDILVNNAGGGTRHPPEIFPMEEWRYTLEVHLTAAFDLSQQAARHMLLQGKGKIINIGSVMTEEGGWNIPAYSAAKHGIAGMTKTLATAWASKGIDVNCISPGYFETTYSNVLKNDAVRGPQIMDRIPRGRWGDPREIAGLAVFLASDASRYMNGSNVVIDGGWLAR